jgi:ubiquinone/menaquinone biosynthesis C-methylase UbiE
MQKVIVKRYTAESGQCSNLSCGSNLGFMDIELGEHVLDLGCGRGNETIETARLAGNKGKATGLDITPAMIEQARAQAYHAGISNIEFVHGDIENLPFEDEAFHAVMSNCVINHARSKKTAYKEIHRVLKIGGRFVISDAVTKEALPDSVKNDPQAWADCYGGAVTEQEYLDSIRDAGFEKVNILNRREYMKNGYDFISLTILAHK